MFEFQEIKKKIKEIQKNSSKLIIDEVKEFHKNFWELIRI